MPDYLKRTGRDTTEDILVRIPDTEKHLSRVRGPASKRLGIDRGDIPSVAAPLEGQMMIQYADASVGSAPVSPDVGPTFIGDKTYYYANGEWRPFTTGFSLNSAEEHLYVPTTSIGADDGLAFDLTYYAGATMMDLSTAGKTIVTTAGVYAVSAGIQVFPPATEPAGDGVDFQVLAVQAAIGWPAGPSIPGKATFVNPGNSSDHWWGSVNVTSLMNAADWFEFGVFNRNSYAVDVVVGVSIVKVLELP